MKDSFSLGELQLLLQGLHIIGEQDQVDSKLIQTWKRLRNELARELEQVTKGLTPYQKFLRRIKRPADSDIKLLLTMLVGERARVIGVTEVQLGKTRPWTELMEQARRELYGD